MANEAPIKICPFLKSDCIQADCNFWWTPGANSRANGCCKFSKVWDSYWILKNQFEKPRHSDAQGQQQNPGPGGSDTRGGIY
jgi:hypothetical protein